MIKDQPQPKLTHNESLKEAAPTLAGTIAATLADTEAERFSEDDNQFLKFHGIYQQDDRDVRKTGKKYIFMIRARVPGGVLAPESYLTYDALAAEYGQDSLRVTTRQTFQFHGVVKSGLGPLMRRLNEALQTTLAACGDVGRNVLAPPIPTKSGLDQRVQADAKAVSDALLPTTSAYHSIWVEGVQLKLEEPKNLNFQDPLYGRTYLPRKFKVAFAIPPCNDVDLYANCLGFIAIADEKGELRGYNVTAGGGMGRSHNNDATYPRLADPVGFVPAERVVEVTRAAVRVYRDTGDRTNRKHARLKYVIEERGVDWFRKELEREAGFALEEPRPCVWESQGDSYGWFTQADGREYLTLFIENGRIRDTEACRLKTALREAVERYRPEVRLTASQNVVFANLDPGVREEFSALLTKHNVPLKETVGATRGASMACVALPTCGLALAESERYLPGLISRVEDLFQELQLGDQEVIVRMTGCPNGCARPYTAELAFVGKAPGRYQLWLGGNGTGTRLNRLYREVVKDPEVIDVLRPLFSRFAEERESGERFGDWCARVLWREEAAAA